MTKYTQPQNVPVPNVAGYPEKNVKTLALKLVVTAVLQKVLKHVAQWPKDR
jgi:hypothetical protein